MNPLIKGAIAGAVKNVAKDTARSMAHKMAYKMSSQGQLHKAERGEKAHTGKNVVKSALRGAVDGMSLRKHPTTMIKGRDGQAVTIIK